MANKKYNVKAVAKYAGAFIAFVIGPGFATGQEMLQFFASFGGASYGVLLLNLVGFLFFGRIIVATGYEHKEQERFNHFKFYCGKWLGAVYSKLVLVFLLMIMSVLIAASGATFSEYYGVHHFIGSAVMALSILTAYLIGFENLVRLVSKIGPVIVAFALFIGIITIINNFQGFGNIGQREEALAHLQRAPHWSISAVIYLSLTFFTASTYYTALGRSADSKKDALLGTSLGAIAIITVIGIINTAILLSIGDSALLSVPTLFLASQISFGLATVFSVVLLLGMFASCSTIMWAVCNQFFTEGSWKNRFVAITTTVIIFVIGLFPFEELVGIFYPIMGYTGLIFIACVAYKGVTKRKSEAS